MHNGSTWVAHFAVAHSWHCSCINALLPTALLKRAAQPMTHAARSSGRCSSSSKSPRVNAKPGVAKLLPSPLTAAMDPIAQLSVWRQAQWRTLRQGQATWKGAAAQMSHGASLVGAAPQCKVMLGGIAEPPVASFDCEAVRALHSASIHCS